MMNPAVPGRTHEKFSFAELDLDGSIVRTEAAFREGLSRGFEQAGGDGKVSRAEFNAWTQPR